MWCPADGPLVDERDLQVRPHRLDRSREAGQRPVPERARGRRGRAREPGRRRRRPRARARRRARGRSACGRSRACRVAEGRGNWTDRPAGGWSNETKMQTEDTWRLTCVCRNGGRRWIGRVYRHSRPTIVCLRSYENQIWFLEEYKKSRFNRDFLFV